MNNKRLFGVCVIFIGLVFVIVGLRLLLEPAKYQATVKIKIEVSYGPGPIPYDPYFLETELIAIRSDVVLSNVVQALNLNAEWGKRYANDGPLGVEDTVGLLRRQMKIDADRGTKLIDVSFIDNNPDEAARIANTIAQAYHDYRQDVARRQMEWAIEILEEKYQMEATNIANIEARLHRLSRELVATNSLPTNQVLLSKSYQMQNELNSRKDLHKLLKSNIEEYKANVGRPDLGLVSIVAPAVPPTSPAGLNRWLGVACIVCGLVNVGYGVGSLRGGTNRSK